MIFRTIDIDITPTIVEFAEHFCEMDADEQADFFSTVAELSHTWKAPVELQLNNVSTSLSLSPDGRRLMEKIGVYAEMEETKNEQ